MTTPTGSARGVPVLRRLRRPSKSTGKRCVRSYTPASAASACASVSPTPTGRAALVIGSAHVAISAGGASISSGTDRVLTFNGSPTITIPAGALAVSDPVTLNVPALGDLAVSLYLPENVAATTQHVEGTANDLHLASGRLHGREHRGGDHDHVLLLPDRRRSPRPGAREGDRDARRLGHRGLRLDDRHEPALAESSWRSGCSPIGAHRALPCSTRASAAIACCMTSSAPARWPGSIAMCWCRPA